MYGVLCKTCKGSFYGNHKKIKIPFKTPAITCKGCERNGCTYCLCSNCFRTKLIHSGSDNTRTKRSCRAVVYSNTSSTNQYYTMN